MEWDGVGGCNRRWMDGWMDESMVSFYHSFLPKIMNALISLSYKKRDMPQIYIARRRFNDFMFR
jgi:hypothetical protein